MSQQQNQKKPKLGQRLARSFFVSMGLGYLAFITSYFFAIAINSLANSTVIPAIPIALFSFAMMLSVGLGIELSKDIEQG